MDRRAGPGKDSKQRLIYFVVNRRNGYIKIGYTVDLHQRMIAVRPEVSGAGITVLGVMDGGKDIERGIHLMFANYRVGSTEWFEPVTPITDFVKNNCRPHDGKTYFPDTRIDYGKPTRPYDYHLRGYEVPIFDYKMVIKNCGL